MTKRLVQFFLVCGFFLQAAARDVTVDQAQCAVDNWLASDPTLGCPLGRRIRAARTCRSPGGASFHVLRLAEGGFVVTSADTTQEPIVAFSSEDDLIETDKNPLWTLLCRAFDAHNPQPAGRLQTAATPSAAEQKWARLLTARPKARLATALPSVSDVRIAPFVASTWGQTTAGGVDCYNLLTPAHYHVGCVATAGAQVMRYFEWPKTAVPAFTNAFCAVDGKAATLTGGGCTYDWSNLPLHPDARTPADQRLALAGLMRDLGVACGMSYGADGSAAGSYMLQRAWTTLFGYASATVYTLVEDLPLDAVQRALISNFDAHLPVVLGISGESGGHAVVGDGYGYSDGTLYYHFNLGWEGNSNAWYAPPDLDAGGYSFSAVGTLVYNIFTERSAGHTIVSGRVLNGDGHPLAGARVYATNNQHVRCAETTTDARGIYALILPTTWLYATPYTLQAETEGETSPTRAIKLKMCISTSVNADGTFNPSTAPAPAVNNLIGQDLTISALTGGEDPPGEEDPPDVPPPADDTTPGDAFAQPIPLDGAAGSHVLEDTSAYTREDDEPLHSLEDGYYYPEARSAWYVWTAPGSGEMTFTASSRRKIGNTTYYLHAMIAAYRGEDLRTAQRIALFDELDADGSSSITFAVTQGERYRLVVFAYADDPYDGPYTLSWQGSLVTQTETRTTPVPVPFAWLRARYPDATDFEGRATATGANGRPVWESYLLNLEPTDPRSELRLTRFGLSDGTPFFGWNVTNENLRALGYEYRIKGKTKPEEPWRAYDAAHRFFRLFVEKVSE